MSHVMSAKRPTRRSLTKPHPAPLLPPEHLVERAAAELRRGAPILIRSHKRGESAIVVAAETVSDTTLASLVKLCGAPSSILTHDRAATLKIRLYTPRVVAVPHDRNVSAAELRAIADPTSDLDFPLKGPFEASRLAPPDAAEAGIVLAKLAGLLPATATFRVAKNGKAAGGWTSLIEVSVEDIRRFDQRLTLSLQILTRARVPLAGSEDAELVAFRPANGGQEHYAVVIGDKHAPSLAPPGPVLARLHSECFTGDFLGSLKCDC